mgnify:CR=1 FL=1
MTTLIYAGNVMASDSQLTTCNIPCNGNSQKIFQSEHLLVGYAGSVAKALRIVDWVIYDHCAPDMKPDLSDLEDSDYDIIVVDKQTKKCWTYEGGALDAIPLSQPTAIGSGSPAAMGAITYMKMNKLPLDAKAAVKCGIACDIFSGGKVQSVDLNPRPKRVKKMVSPKAVSPKE